MSACLTIVDSESATVIRPRLTLAACRDVLTDLPTFLTCPSGCSLGHRCMYIVLALNHLLICESECLCTWRMWNHQPRVPERTSTSVHATPFASLKVPWSPSIATRASKLHFSAQPAQKTCKTLRNGPNEITGRPSSCALLFFSLLSCRLAVHEIQVAARVSPLLVPLPNTENPVAGFQQWQPLQRKVGAPWLSVGSWFS